MGDALVRASRRAPLERDDRGTLAARTFAVIFSFTACLWVRASGIFLLAKVQAFSKSCKPSRASGRRVVIEDHFFQREYVARAHTLHHMHAAGHLHRSHPPFRLAHVDRWSLSTRMAMALLRGQKNILERSEPLGRGTVTCSMSIRTDSTMLVRMSVLSVRRARGLSAAMAQEPRHAVCLNVPSEAVDAAGREGNLEPF